MQTTQPNSRASLTWIGQAISGVLLLGLLGTHMIAHHYVVEGGLRTYAQVLDYIGNPLVVAVELTFLLVVTYHALLGIRAILLDLGLSAGQQLWLNRSLIVLGLLTIGYGFWLTLTLFSRA